MKISSMKNTTLTIALFSLAILIFSCEPKEKEWARPNILWINADDLGPELACYGNPDVSTPNIDAIAKEGILYSRAYSNTPICSPSRSSLITGMYPPSVNAHDHRTLDMTDLPEGIVPVTKYFQEAGYFVSLGNAEKMSKLGKEDYNFLYEDLYDGTDWTGRKEGQPFFAQVHIHYPHRTFKHHKNAINPYSVSFPEEYPDHPLLRADWAHYLESVQHCDDWVGTIMKRLEEEGLVENTIVFFFGDHGRPHLRDKQFLYEGGLKIPLIVRWPAKYKQKVDDQLVSLVDVTATSLALAGINLPDYLHGKPFLGEKAEKQKYIFGFRDRAGDADDNIRSITDGEYKLIWNRMSEQPYMQLSSYKKAQYPAFTLYNVLHKQGKLEAPFNQFMAQSRPEIELYNLEDDPNEYNNLAKDESLSKKRDELFGILKENMPAFEKNLIPEKPETLKKAQDGSYNFYKKIMNDRGLNPDLTDEEFLKWWEAQLLTSSNH
ncbi:MAG: sulfatase [Cyclobacteriaceae bacterium]